MVRVLMMVDEKDFGVQRTWNVTQISRVNLPIMVGRYKRRAWRYGSFWMVTLDWLRFNTGLDYKYKLYINYREALLSDWFVTRMGTVLETAEYIRRMGPQLGVKTVVVVSNKAGTDMMRNVVADMIRAVVFEEYAPFRPQLTGGIYGDIEVFETVAEDYIVLDNEDYLVFVHSNEDPTKWYWWGDKSLYKRALGEVI